MSDFFKGEKKWLIIILVAVIIIGSIIYYNSRKSTSETYKNTKLINLSGGGKKVV